MVLTRAFRFFLIFFGGVLLYLLLSLLRSQLVNFALCCWVVMLVLRRAYD